MSNLVRGVHMEEEDRVNIKADVAMFMNSAHVYVFVYFAGKFGHSDFHLINLALRRASF